MRSAKNIALLLLSLTTLAGGAIAWRQYQELLTLRPLAMKAPEPVKSPPPEIAAPAVNAEGQGGDAAGSASDNRTDSPPADHQSRRTTRANSDRGGNFRRIMERPEVQRLLALQQKAELDGRYATLFRQLNLSPAQLDAFKNLLVDKATALMDVRAAAREQGIDPRRDRDTYQKLITDAQAQVDENIRTQLGEAAFNQYKSYEATQPQRAVVDQLQQRLSYSSTPLTDAQSTQLVQLLASSPSSASGPMVPFGPGAGNRNRVTVTDATINQALGVLAGPQIDALRQIQQEQQLQEQLNAAMRAQYQNRGNQGPTTAPGAAAPASNSGRAGGG